MDPKPRPNLDRQIAVLRHMTAEKRLLKAFELGEMVREAHRAGVRLRNPGASDEEVRRLAVAEWLEGVGRIP